MNNQRRDIYLRAHTEKVREKKKSKKSRKKKDTVQPDRIPERALIFDAEVRTTMDGKGGYQALMFGIFRVCVLVNGEYKCEREGIFYSGENEKGTAALNCPPSAVLDEGELNTIGKFVSAEPPDVEVNSFPPKMSLEVHQTFTTFMEKVFWPAVRRGDLIVCYNSPFDLSRLSRDWRKSRKGGFSLIMGHRFWRKTEKWIPDPYRPVIRIEPKDARVAFITRGRPKIAPKKKKNQKWDWSRDGRFLDVGTLLFSLFDKHMSLDAWCEHFGIDGKLKDEDGETYEPSGRVTLEELAYCRNDVLKTQFLLNKAIAELDKHELPDLLPDESYSSASIGKAYLSKINITPPKEKFNDFSPKNSGIAMQCYYGGRAEVHIRRTTVPVMRLDFVSQYPTVNTLLGNEDVLKAESVTFEDATDEVRHFLEELAPKALETCFKREPWRHFNFFALVSPDHDIFPVRAPYDEKEPDKLNIGDNYLTSTKPLWYAGPDIIASLIRTGKVPTIVKAVRLVAHETQKEMQDVKLMGEIPFHPYQNGDEFFKLIIEAKERASRDAELAKKNGDKTLEIQNKALKHALKIIANSTSYGCFVQLNEQKQSTKIKIFSGEYFDPGFNETEVETPGPYYFSPVAAQITAGGRLLLSMAEACITEAGGTWMAADTDSIMVVANRDGREVAGARKRVEDDIAVKEGSISKKEFAPVPALSHEMVRRISQRFASLNPYTFPGTILKIEDVNYEDEDSKKPLRTVYGYAISGKRYVLFTYKKGRVKIVDAKGHGLGFLRAPVRNPKSWNKKWPYWIELAWLYVLRNEGIIFEEVNVEFLDRPAMMQIPVSSPDVLGRLKYFVRPYDFVLAPIVNKDKLDTEQQANKPILITRFTKNSEEWASATFYNVRTGKPCRITTTQSADLDIVPVKSYRQILNGYPLNPEQKFLAPGGLTRCDQWTRGILERDHVIANQHIPCGKEHRSKLDQGLIDHPDAEENQSTPRFSCRVYQNRKVAADLEMVCWLSNFTEEEIKEATGLERKTIRLVRHGQLVKRSTYQKIKDFRTEYEGTQGVVECTS